MDITMLESDAGKDKYANPEYLLEIIDVNV